MKAARDQNDNCIYPEIRREDDGTWSRNVWWGHACATNIERRYGYKSRKAAMDGDISESATETNKRH